MERSDQGAWAMSGNPSSPNQEDIRSLLEELRAVKEILKDVSRQLLRIERRAKAAIPSGESARTDRTRQSGSEKRPPLDEHSAQQVIESLKERVSKGEQIEMQLRDFSVKPDLHTIARLLGMTNTKLPPKDELVRRISTRLRQSVSVTTGIHENARNRVTSDEKLR